MHELVTTRDVKDDQCALGSGRLRGHTHSRCSGRAPRCAVVLVALIAGCASSTAPPVPDALVASRTGSASIAPAPDFDALMARYQEEQTFLRAFGRDQMIAQTRWTDDACYVRRGRDWIRVAFSDGSITGPDDVSPPPAVSGPRGLPRPVRGRQRAEEPSPCGRWVAVCKDHNVVLRAVSESDDDAADDADADADAPAGGDAAGADQGAKPESTEAREILVTSGGTRRLGYGRASWVYGEELAQDTGMWWSPCSEWLAFYHFDDREVPDFHLATDWTRGHTRIVSEAYPKPGDPNPIAGLQIYHLPTGVTREIDVWAHANPDEPEFYIYRVSFAPADSSLLFHRLNRHQNHLELLLWDPRDAVVRVIAQERQKTWQNYRPDMRFLEDGRRMLWESERSGFRAYDLRDLSGEKLAVFAVDGADIDGIDRVVEGTGDNPDPGFIVFSAFGIDDPHDRHPWIAPLDGSSSPRRLLHERGRHDVTVSPCGQYFMATRQSVDHPATYALHRTSDGSLIADLGGVEPQTLTETGRALPERFVVTAADGKTPLHGVLYRPKDLRPGERRPLVVQIYGGPGFRAVSGRFSPGNAATAFGWFVMQLDGRGSSGRGKEFMGEVYLRMGEVEVDDHAAAVSQLLERFPEIDPDAVGIFGHSYGGYASLMAMLRHPDIFHAASAGAPVTDWRQYDTIYTERYMRTPAENAEGYDRGSAVVHAKNLKGDLLILHGMVDDNVHPNNVFAMMRVMQEEDLPFTLMMYPNAGHGLPAHAQRLRWRFLIESLADRGAQRTASERSDD